MNKGDIIMSDSLSQLIQKASNEQKVQIYKVYEHCSEEYSELVESNPENVISIVSAFNSLIQDEVDNSLKITSYNVSCKQGCSFCCYQKVDISEHEALLLFDVMKERNIQVSKRRLKMQNVDTKTYLKLNKQTRKCVFLNDNEECLVYEYRPSVCRKLNVISEPELCDIDTNKNAQVSRMVNAKVEILSAVVMNKSKCLGMSEHLLNLLNK